MPYTAISHDEYGNPTMYADENGNQVSAAELAAQRQQQIASDPWSRAIGITRDEITRGDGSIYRHNAALDFARQLGIPDEQAAQWYAEGMQSNYGSPEFAGATDQFNRNLMPAWGMLEIARRSGAANNPAVMDYLRQFANQGNTEKDNYNATESKTGTGAMLKFGVGLASMAIPGLMGAYPGQGAALGAGAGEGAVGWTAAGEAAAGGASPVGSLSSIYGSTMEPVVAGTSGGYVAPAGRPELFFDMPNASIGFNGATTATANPGFVAPTVGTAELAQIASGGSSIANTVKNAMTGKNAISAATGLASAVAQGDTGLDPMNSVDAIRAAEDARVARVRANTDRVNSQFAGFDDNYYASLADTYANHYNPLLKEQYTEAQRKVPMRFATRDSSAYQREAGNLERDYGRAQADIGKAATDFATQQRANVEGVRSNLTNMAASDLDADVITQQAGEQAKILNAQPTFSPLADLFSKYTGDYANANLASKYGYQSIQRPLLFGTSGTGTSRGTRTVN